MAPATGDYGPHSDVDLLAIGAQGDFRRVRDVVDGLAVEAMVGAWSWYEEVITVHERSQNIGTITAMVAHARPIAGAGSRFDAWRRSLAAHGLSVPKPPMEPSSRLPGADLTLFGNFVDARSEPARRWLGWCLLTEVADYAFKAGRWWQEKPRRVMAAWSTYDPVAAGLAREALLHDFPESVMDQLISHVTGDGRPTPRS